MWTYPAPTSSSSLCTEDDYEYFWSFEDASIFTGYNNGVVEIYTDLDDKSGSYLVYLLVELQTATGIQDHYEEFTIEVSSTCIDEGVPTLYPPAETEVIITIGTVSEYSVAFSMSSDSDDSTCPDGAIVYELSNVEPSSFNHHDIISTQGSFAFIWDDTVEAGPVEFTIRGEYQNDADSNVLVRQFSFTLIFEEEASCSTSSEAVTITATQAETELTFKVGEIVTLTYEFISSSIGAAIVDPGFSLIAPAPAPTYCTDDDGILS